MQKLFLDTNFVLDFLGERHDFYLPCAQIMTLADQRRVELLTSPASVSTAFYLLAKFEDADAVLNKIRKFKPLCRISVMDDEVVEKALNSGFTDFEDALQYFSALASRCDVIITRNEKDFKLAKIPVMDANAYLRTFNNPLGR